MSESHDRILEAQSAIDELVEELSVAASRAKLVEDARRELAAAARLLEQNIAHANRLEEHIERNVERMAADNAAALRELSSQLDAAAKQYGDDIERRLEEIAKTHAATQKALRGELLKELHQTGQSARQALLEGADLIRVAAASVNETGTLSIELVEARRRASDAEVQRTVGGAVATITGSTAATTEALTGATQAARDAGAALMAAAQSAAAYSNAAKRDRGLQNALLWLVAGQVILQICVVAYLLISR